MQEKKIKITLKNISILLLAALGLLLNSCSSNSDFTITGMEIKDAASATSVTFPQTATIYTLAISYTGSQTPAIREGVILIDDVETSASIFTSYTSDTINVVLEQISEPGSHKITVKLYTKEDSTVNEYSKSFTFITTATSLEITGLELYEYSETAEEFTEEVENPSAEVRYVLKIICSGDATPNILSDNSKIFVDGTKTSRSYFLFVEDTNAYALLVAQTEGEHKISVVLVARENSAIVSKEYSKSFTFSAKASS